MEVSSLLSPRRLWGQNEITRLLESPLYPLSHLARSGLFLKKRFIFTFLLYVYVRV